MRCKSGFNRRLMDAMSASGIPITPEHLAKIIHRPVEYAAHLLACDRATHVPAVVVFRFSDRTNYSGRWVLTGESPPTKRIAVTPDEKQLLECFRSLTDAGRDRILAHLARYRRTAK